MKHATSGGQYKVPKEHDSWRSIALAAAMHAVLVFFLWIGVHWQSNEPVAVEAEVWDMKVQSAAPPPPPPAEAEPEPEVQAPPHPVAPPEEVKPAPREPDIALERLKAKVKAEKEKQKLEELKLAKLKKEADEKLAKLKAKEEADKKLAEQKAKEDKLKAEKEKKELADKKLQADKLTKAKLDKAQEKARAAEMSRITGAIGAGTTGTAARSTAPRSDASYEAAIIAKIKSNLVYGGTDDTLKATFTITQLPSGEIIGVRKVKGSGQAAYDSAVENAIAKSSPLPKKKDGTVVRELTADFKLKD